MKLFIVEEHHEVLPIWLSYPQFLLSKKLLHVDYHSDMYLPTVDRPLQTWKELSKNDLLCTVFEQLHINDFIIAAIYLGIFNKIYWLQPTPIEQNIIKPDNKIPPEEEYNLPLSAFVTKSVNMAVESLRSEGKHLIVKKNNISKKQPDSKSFLWGICNQTLTEGNRTPSPITQQASTADNNFVLDIEFDYFLCNPQPCIKKRIEVSYAEFCSYQDNPYHFLRLHYHTKAYEHNGHYYVEFNPWVEESSLPQEISKRTLAGTIKKFTNWLNRIHITPSLITLCRAKQSGFCPEPAVDIIEELLISNLQEIYEFDIIKKGVSQDYCSLTQTIR